MVRALSSEESAQTFFAKPGRASHNEIVDQLHASLEDPCVKVVLEAVDGFVMILNEHRQLLAANQELIDSISRDDPQCVVGLRPGEVMNCIHFTEGPDGCGTAKHCRTCGAVLALLASQRNEAPAQDECRLSVFRKGEFRAMDLKVRATPLHINGHKLTAFVLHDISSLKRREVLEQTFFHDFLNTIGGLEGWSQRLQETAESDAAREIVHLSERLKEEVLSHRTLLQAERGTLRLNNEHCEPGSLLEQLRLLFDHHAVAKDKQLIVTPPATAVRFRTDKSLLVRVLSNMLKNAFEATPAGSVVRLSFEVRDGRPTFLVHNEAVISEDVKLRIFDRSFSTHREPGRGLGTYSMKLFGERFLHGEVSFVSEPGEGTTFWISLPAELQTSAPPPAQETRPECQNPSLQESSVRLLLVDDLESVLRLNTSFLSSRGYDVVACASGEEALRQFAAAPESFAAVVTDLRMAGMSGIGLARRITERSSVPVLLCTGIADSLDEEQARSAGVRSVLQKPYSLHELAKAIEHILAGD